jgi:ABC-type sugar transport system ATPase subunit
VIQLDHLTVRAGTFALREVCLDIAAGQHAVLMGRTGTGKTTLLEAVCGLRRVTAGRIRLGGDDVTEMSPGARAIGFVPQDGALFGHLTVQDHLAFGLRVRRWRPAAIAQRLAELSAWLGLKGLLDRHPAGLSGGEAQRVALGRALAFHPRVLCLDEPLSALDDQTRDEVKAVLQDLRRRTGVTILHVTHSQADARDLADRVVVLRDGRIISVGGDGGSAP